MEPRHVCTILNSFYSPGGSEEASLNTAVDNVVNPIKNNGGEIAKIDRWASENWLTPLIKPMKATMYL